jgi:hypothetical protein
MPVSTIRYLDVRGYQNAFAQAEKVTVVNNVPTSLMMPEMKTEPLAMSQMVCCMEGRKEHLFRSGGDLSIDTGRPYKGWEI